MRVKITH